MFLGVLFSFYRLYSTHNKPCLIRLWDREFHYNLAPYKSVILYYWSEVIWFPTRLWMKFSFDFYLFISIVLLLLIRCVYFFSPKIPFLTIFFSIALGFCLLLIFVLVSLFLCYLFATLHIILYRAFSH